MHETHSTVVRDDSLEHLGIKKNVELAGSHRCQLTKHDIFRDTTAIIKFTNGSSLEKDLNSFFERTSHESTCIGTIDTMTGDSHQVATRSHDINQERKMSMIDIRTVKCQHLCQFFHQRGAGSLNAEDLEDLDEVIGIGALCINTRNSQD
jgi:hypothetical protein